MSEAPTYQMRFYDNTADAPAGSILLPEGRGMVLVPLPDHRIIERLKARATKLARHVCGT